MQKEFCLFSIVLLLISNLLLCIKENEPDPQPDTTYWTKKFGSSETDIGRSVQQTYDGGFIIAGETFFLDYAFDVYLIRTNSKGEKIWSKAYGGYDNDNAFEVQQTKDSGFIIAGSSSSFGGSDYDVYLIRTNSNGDTLWTKTFGGTGWDGGFSMDQTTDNGFIIAGYTESTASGIRDVYLIKTDPSGTALWEKTYGKDSADWATSVRQTSDGGFIIAGCTDSCGTSNREDFFNEIFSRDMFSRGSKEPDTRDVYLIRTDPKGDTLWTKTYGGTRHDGAYSVRQTPDGGFIIAGETWSFGAGSADVYLTRTDENGDTLWTKTYGGAPLDKGFSITLTKEGGFAIAGSTESFYTGSIDAYLIVTNSSGEMLWHKNYNEGMSDQGYSIQQTFDGGFVIAGYSSSNSGLEDVYLIKQNKQ